MQILTGHISPETAFLVQDYPYGYHLRTQIRYWIETRVGTGERFCHQTLNPKTGQWNKEKCSTYSKMILLGIDPANNHVVRVDVPDGINTTYDELKAFYVSYGEFFTDYQRKEFELIIAARVSHDLHKTDFAKVTLKEDAQLSWAEYQKIMRGEFITQVRTVHTDGLDKFLGLDKHE